MRERLPNRRGAVTCRVTHTSLQGKEHRLTITVGFDERGMPKEVFCADWKAGTDMHALVVDACIMFSRLLQHGDDPLTIERSMCEPLSLIGTIARAVAEVGPRDDAAAAVAPVRPNTPQDAAQVELA